MQGEIDFDAETDLREQEEQNDANSEMRILISNNFPALIVILQQASKLEEPLNEDDERTPSI